MKERNEVTDLRHSRETKVTFVSHTEIGGDFVVGSHHLARELSKLGLDVTHISSPQSVVHDLLRKGTAHRRASAKQGRQRDSDGVSRWVPRTLLPSQVLGRGEVLARFRRQGVRQADIVFIDEPLLASRAFTSPHGVTIYRSTDLYETGQRARRQEWLRRNADAFVATSTVVMDGLKLGSNERRLILPNGVNFEHFTQVPDGSRSGIAYVGALDERFDWRALAELAQRLPDEDFDIAGPIPVGVPAIPRNVHLLGTVPYSHLPAFLASHKVGLLPFVQSRLNDGRSPMKLFEYLAAGLFVLRSRHNDSEQLGAGVFDYSTVDEAVDQLSSLMTLDGLNIHGRELAAGQSWRYKAEALLEFARQVWVPDRSEKPRIGDVRTQER